MEKNFCYALDNSGTIYADKNDGCLYERKGVLIEATDDGEYITTPEHKYGFSKWDDEEEYYDIDETFPIIGKRGDKWDSLHPMRELIECLVRRGTEDYDILFDNVDEYFEVDKSKAEDVIWLECDTDVAGEYTFRLDLHSKFYALGSPFFFDYTKDDKHFQDPFNGKKRYKYNMKHIVALFSAYQDWLKKPLKVRISFAYWTNPYSKEDYIERKNIQTRMLEEKYAQQIEEYINKGLYDSLHEHDDWENVKKPYERRMMERWHSERIPQEWWKKW